MKDHYVELDDILKAREMIAGKVHRTPMHTSTILGEQLGIRLYLKAELFQKTGSFKPRGAFNKLHHLTDAEKARGAITLSAGNHAQGLSYAASRSGIAATVVMPHSAPQSKVDAVRGYGGEIVFHDMMGAMSKMREIQEERDLTFVHPFDDPLVIAGQGTIGLEILEDVADPALVVVPVGGGGLISGIATALKEKRPSVRVVGVEPVGSNVIWQSLQQNKVVHLDSMDTIADGLGAPFAGENTLAHIQRYVDDIVLVTDTELMKAMGLLMTRCKLVTEPAGAAAFAALWHGKVDVSSGETVVCVLSGGNVDTNLLKTIF